MKILFILLTLFTSLNAMEYGIKRSDDIEDFDIISVGRDSSDLPVNIAPPPVPMLPVNVAPNSTPVRMVLQSPTVPIVRLQDLYNRETKVLNLSDIPLGNYGLSTLFEELKTFIEAEKVETLLLEHMELFEIPYYVITFILLNKTLRYVSMQYNNFRIAVMSPDSSRRVSFLLNPMASTEGPQRPSAAEDSSFMRERSMSGTSTSGLRNPQAALAVNIVQGLWETIAPEIERTIAEHNITQNTMQFYKKIIIIDKNLPPITIINQDKLPSIDRCSKIKVICERMVFIGIGAFVTMLPTLLTYFLTKDDDGSN